MDRKKIVLVGANGNISRQLIPFLIKHYEVHCVVRSSPSFGINSIFLKFVEGDALDPITWDCLQGKHTVISCFGVRQGQSEDRIVQFTNLLIQKMNQHGVKRFIGFYSHGALKDNQGKQIYKTQNFHQKEKAKHHTEAINLLHASQLDYTALCLWKFQVGSTPVGAIHNGWNQTPADSQGVAKFVHHQLQQPSFSKHTIFLYNKPQ